MNHYDAYFNCATNFGIEFNQSQDTLRFYEISIASGYATCMCNFEISATISGITPGTYVAEIYQKQYPHSDIELYDRRELILE